MSLRSEACEFDQATRERIRERDQGCVFCQILFRMPPVPLPASDIMHIVSRAHGGLGIEQNGVVGCRWHHEMLDNGHDGERPAMMEYLESYMRRFYPNWSKQKLIYRKDLMK